MLTVSCVIDTLLHTREKISLKPLYVTQAGDRETHLPGEPAFGAVQAIQASKATVDTE